jgi:Zn-dependent M32 family carboxypeptidase
MQIQVGIEWLKNNPGMFMQFASENSGVQLELIWCPNPHFRCKDRFQTFEEALTHIDKARRAMPRSISVAELPIRVWVDGAETPLTLEQIVVMLEQEKQGLQKRVTDVYEAGCFEQINPLSGRFEESGR